RKTRVPPEINQQEECGNDHRLFLAQHGGKEQKHNRSRPGPGDGCGAPIQESRNGGSREETAERFRTARDVCHGFGLYRMEKEYQRGKGREQGAARWFVK